MTFGLVLLFPPDVAPAHYDAVNAHLAVDRLTGDNYPEGMLSHAAGMSDEGFMVTEVWASKEERATFADGPLSRAFEAAGMPEPVRTSWFEVLPIDPA